MASSPLASPAPGEPGISMLTASCAYNSRCACSFSPLRHSSTNRLAICSVFMVYSREDGNHQTRPFCCQRDVSRDHLLHVVQRADHALGVIVALRATTWFNWSEGL